MQTKSCIEIVPLCHRSAPCCLGLAERTFGKDFTKYKAINHGCINCFNKFSYNITPIKRPTL
jgi:hypothetical protein